MSEKLDINNLNDLLINNGFIPKKYFVNYYLKYILVFNTKNNDIFLIKINRKFKFKINLGDNVVEIKEIKILNKYIQEKNDIDINDMYNNINLNQENNIEKHLEDNYEISIKIENNDNPTLQQIFRQIKRLKFCVKNINYKITIFYNKYLCTLENDKILFYVITNNNISINKNLSFMLNIDINNLYKNLANISYESYEVKKNIYKILRKNHTTNKFHLVSNLQKNTNLITHKGNKILKSHKKSIKYLEELENFMNKLENTEKIIKKQIKKTKETFEYKTKLSNNDNNFLSEIKNDKSITNKENELFKITIIKKDIFELIYQIKTNYEHSLLRLDSIMFDNTVMLNSINKNFNLLYEL
jgi:hypothetical protein